MILFILLLAFFSFPAYASPVNTSGQEAFNQTWRPDLNKLCFQSHATKSDAEKDKPGGSRDGDHQKGYGDDEREERQTVIPKENETTSDAAAPTEPTVEPSGEQITGESSGTETAPMPAATSAADRNSTVTLSRQQIQQQVQVNPENLTIIKNGIKLVLPAGLLTNRLPEDSDQFRVTIDYDGTNRFQIRFYIDESPVTDLGGDFTVFIPWQGETDGLYCYQASHQSIPVTAYDNGFLEFTLRNTGQYQIDSRNLEETLPSATEEYEQPAAGRPQEIPKPADPAATSVQTLPWKQPYWLLILSIPLFIVLILAGRYKRRRDKERSDG